MPGQASPWIRLLAARRGEVAADALENSRRSGRIVYEELRHAERSWREDLRVKAASSPEATERLIVVWYAYVLQVVGEHMLDADYAARPQTAGFVSMTTAEQVAVFFDGADSWMARSGGPATDLSDRAVQMRPAPFPRWVKIDPCPRAHLLAMVAAGKEIIECAGRLLTQVARVSRTHTEPVGDARHILAEASATIYFAQEMLADGPRRGDRAAVAHHLRRAIETLYGFGRVAAAPHLLNDDE
ncbi:hypothetical protein GCM10023196_049850 [Actinoallomurus vinaceus]|uniref:Uncharacterized protein n=1 Tax=Actinoallomurus vinaceus TaxID=1080074 RepID=A0ABP8UFL6_9ACTN